MPSRSYRLPILSATFEMGKKQARERRVLREEFVCGYGGINRVDNPHY